MSTALSRLPSIRSHKRLTKEQKQIQLVRAVNNYNNALNRFANSYSHGFNNPTNKVFQEQFRLLNKVTQLRARKARAEYKRLKEDIKKLKNLQMKTPNLSTFKNYARRISNLKKQLKIEKSFI